MRILFASSECAPFAKTGGLGDVVGALPKALKLLGHDVRILLPKYQLMDVSSFQKSMNPIGIPMGSDTAWCAVHSGLLTGSSVPVYALEYDAAFSGPGIYGGEGGTLAGSFKFGLLSRAAFELCRWLDWYPDVIHTHDWPTAWVPPMANGPEAAYAAKIAHVLTIHNMSHQPKFPAEALDVLGLGRQFYRVEGFEDFGAVNPFKAGIYHTNMITTVSPRYAHEIRGPALGCGLEPAIEYRAADLVGILNGIDEHVWDPSRDPLLPATYSVDDLSGKAHCKRALESRMNLDHEPNGPLIGMISRLAWQKGLDVVAASLERLLATTGARIVLLGSGEPWMQARFSEIAANNPGRFSVYIGYNEELAHLIEAGADLYLMPSRFEPCGLNQLYSQRYGTLPIVHSTGGLEDTVEQCDPSRRSGTGFKMYNLHPDSLVNTVRWAVEVYRQHPELFKRMQLQSMRKKMGWDVAAAQYEDVYKWAVERRLGRHPA